MYVAEDDVCCPRNEREWWLSANLLMAPAHNRTPLHDPPPRCILLLEDGVNCLRRNVVKVIFQALLLLFIVKNEMSGDVRFVPVARCCDA
jgi:hypothetical protein